MKQETTPSKVTDKIMKLCEGISADTEPIYLSVSVPKWSLPNECFLNVQRMVRDHGGQQVNGWAIWQWANVLVEAEAHSVWKSPKGELIDVTPHINKENKILFIPDDKVSFTGYSIDSIRMTLTNSPLIAELIEIKKWLFSVSSSYPANEKITLMGQRASQYREVCLRHDQIMHIIHQDVGRNDPCPCQSGLKYKKCCGRE